MDKSLLHSPLLDVLCEHLTDRAICLLNGSGQIAGWNKGAAKFYKCNDADVNGEPANILFINAPLKKALQTAIAKGFYQGEWLLAVNKQKVLVIVQPVKTGDEKGGFALLCQDLIDDKKSDPNPINKKSVSHTGNSKYELTTNEAEVQLNAVLQELSAYKYALDHATIVAVTDQSGIITHANDYFCRISGYSRDELIGQDHYIVNSGYHPKEYIKELWRTIASGQIWRGELCNRAKDGHLYWVATTIVPFLNAEGKPYQYIAIRYDITEAKAAEEELQRVFETVPDMICTVDADHRYKQVNPAMCKVLGYTEEELLGKKVDDLIYPADLAESHGRMRQFMVNNLQVVNYENRYLRKDGSVVYLAWSVRKTDQDIFFCVAKDITEKKELEELLRKSSQLARIGNWALYPQTGYVYWSPITRELLEVSADFDMQWGMADIFCGPGSLETINDAIARVISGDGSFNVEIEVKTGKGHDRWVKILGEGEFDGDKCTRVYGTVQDIDSSKRAQFKLDEQAEELSASSRRYSELFHMSPLPMFVFDAESLEFIDVNEAAINNYGYSREEFLQMTLRDIRPPEELKKLNEVTRAKGRTDYQYRPGVFTHLTKTGKRIQVEIVSSILRYLDRPARLALAVDVTEKNEYLTKVEAQNQKLREISWMQSHIIRAPLSRIMGLVNLLRETRPTPEEVTEIVDYIQISADELDQVIRNITNSANETEG